MYSFQTLSHQEVARKRQELVDLAYARKPDLGAAYGEHLHPSVLVIRCVVDCGKQISRKHCCLNA